MNWKSIRRTVLGYPFELTSEWTEEQFTVEWLRYNAWRPGLIEFLSPILLAVMPALIQSQISSITRQAASGLSPQFLVGSGFWLAEHLQFFMWPAAVVSLWGLLFTIRNRDAARRRLRLLGIPLLPP